MTVIESTELVPDPAVGDPILDNPALASLTGPHRRFGQRHGRAARYLPEVAPFVALLDPDDPQAWRDAVSLVGPGGSFAVAGTHIDPPAGWTTTAAGAGVQMVDVGVEKTLDPEAMRLGASDVPEILDLVARTQPGPFGARTVELGTYLGIRRHGAQIAMAGERMHPEDWTEISAVCTDPAHRRQGLGGRLVSAVAAGIADRGEKIFLHASAANVTAIRLYEAMGFRLRLTTQSTRSRRPTAERAGQDRGDQPVGSAPGRYPEPGHHQDHPDHGDDRANHGPQRLSRHRRAAEHAKTLQPPDGADQDEENAEPDPYRFLHVLSHLSGACAAPRCLDQAV
jgi:GNAT superfamily N-acetyltransferase